jgi:hypothetical protein
MTPKINMQKNILGGDAMRGNIVNTSISECQNGIFNWVRNCGCGCLAALPVAILDVTLVLLNPLLSVIEHLAFTVINFLGFLLCRNNCTLKDTFYSFEAALVNALSIPAVAVMTPFKFLYQLINIMFNVNYAYSIRYNSTDCREIDHLNSLSNSYRFC